MTGERAGEAGAGSGGVPGASEASSSLASSESATPPHADVDEDRTASPVPLAVVRAAGEARDPRVMGIVLSRMFGRAVQPQRIGRFILLDRLGEGGMGVVYAAYDDRLDRKIAVKVLRSTAQGTDPSRRQRLVQEARALARLSHPNIVTVHEVDTHGDDVFVAMEHVRGQSLDRWIEGPDGAGRPWHEVVEVLAAAGRGLAAAHRAGIVHRDFKPHNVVVGEDGVVKVLDFGLASMLGAPPTSRPPGSAEPEDGVALTRTGALVGTPAYMAPEQYEGAGVDARSDQFSFFVTLYQALYRQLPFSASAQARAALVASDGLVPTPRARSSVPRWLQRAVQVGLAADPERRHPTMEAALVAITRDPAARRRRVLALGGLVTVVALGSAAAVAAWGLPAAAPCEHGVAAMDRAWGPGARAQVHQGLLASGVPFGDETWSRLEPRLAAYVEAWASTRDETCRAHRDGATSDRLYDRQVACLELRLASFDALVELLGNADPGAAARSLAAAATLPAAPACIGAVALTDAVAPPEGAELAREVEAQRRRLARVVELEALGRYADGRQEARAVVEDAERLRYRPLLAEALVRDGSLAMEHGAPDEAEDLLTAALGHALATDHVDVALEAIARRIFVRAERMRTPERAEDDVASGAGLLDRVGGDPRLRTLYLNNVGSFHIRRNAPEAARRVLEQALEVGSSLGPDEPSRVQTLGNLAIAEERAGLDEPARTHLAEALELARRALGPQHPTVAELARLRGELLLRTGHLRAAQAALQEALELLRAAVGPRSPLHHAPLVLLGELALEERRHADAEAWFQQAAALELAAEGGGEMYGMLEQTGLARAWWGRGEPQRARAGLEREVARAEASAAPYAAALHLLYGRTLLLHGDPAAALPQLRRAVELEAQHGNARSRVAAVAFLGQGQALARLGRLDEAEAALSEALARLEDTPHRRDRAWALVERSGVAAAQGQRALAIAHARAAVEWIEPWGEPEHPDHALAWAALARALRMGTPTVAEQREAEALAERARASLSARGEAFSAELAELARGFEGDDRMKSSSVP